MGTHYLYDPINGQVDRELDDNGNVLVEYTREPDGTLLSEHRNGVSKFYHFDGAGNTTALTDINGDVTDTFEYNAFGEETARTGTTPTPFRYHGAQGFYFDENTGDYMVQGRPMSPVIDRWLSLLSTVGRSSYAYALVANGAQKGGKAKPEGNLKVVTLDATKGDCGKESGVLFDFFFPNGAPCDGYIVQKIYQHQTINDCTKCPAPPKAGDNPLFKPFWEAWEIEDGKMRDVKVEDGTFKFTDARVFNPADKTCGLDITLGEVRFYCKDRTGDLGGHDRPSSDDKNKIIWVHPTKGCAG